MEQRLKERLFGAIIIISLFVIFIPMVFRTPDDGSLIKEQGKAMPEIKTSDLAVPAPLADWQETVKQSHKPVISTKKAAWAIQLATFANRANADKLITQLQAKGYQAYLEVVPGHEQTLTWVMVGPHQSKQSALARQDELKAQFKMNGLVVQSTQTG
jgi:DedD protein